LTECRNLKGCKTGQAKITKGYQLPAKYVIHTVGPIWSGGTKNEAKLLRSCYKKSLELAKKYSLTSIAFPAISCGVYQYPLEQAAEIAIMTIEDSLQINTNLETVYLACLGESLFQTYQTILARRQI